MQAELELMIHPPLGRMQAPMTAVKGGPLIDISNRPRDIRSKAKKFNIFEQGKKKINDDGNDGTTDHEHKNKDEDEDDERFLCENDRVPPHVVEQHRAQIQRSRNHSEWQSRKEFRRKGNSRVLNQPSHDVSEWMEELDRLAEFQLPKGWVTQKQEDGKLSYLHIDTKERRTQRPLSARNQAIADVQHKLDTGYVARIDSGGRPRSATVGVRLILEDFDTEIPGTPALLARYPFMELTGNKEEEEAAERLRMKQERAKFDKKFNLILDNVRAKRGNLRDFEKMAIREWGEGTPDVDKAVSKARLVLPLGPDKPKQQPVAKKLAQGDQQAHAAEVGDKIEPNIVPDKTKPTPTIKGGSSDAKDTSGKPKAITFDAAVGEGATEAMRPESATVSAKSFGSPGFQTRRQLLRSPQRGRPIPAARQPSPVKARSLLRDPAEWIAMEAEREQALEDADTFLAACAPPPSRPAAATFSPITSSASVTLGSGQGSGEGVATRESAQCQASCTQVENSPSPRTVSQEAPAASVTTPHSALVRPSSEQGTRATPSAHLHQIHDLEARPSTSEQRTVSQPEAFAPGPFRPMTAASLATTRLGGGSQFGEVSRPGSTASKGGVFGLFGGSSWGGSERGDDSRPGSTGTKVGGPVASRPQSVASRPPSSEGSDLWTHGASPRGLISQAGSMAGTVGHESAGSRPTTAGSVSFYNVEGEHAIFRSPEESVERQQSAGMCDTKAVVHHLSKEASDRWSSSSANLLRPVSATGAGAGALKPAKVRPQSAAVTVMTMMPTLEEEGLAKPRDGAGQLHSGSKQKLPRLPRSSSARKLFSQ
mmetsp:Transcript_35233/g.85788  ORF Transcript_35233/g.85788 Transcript_35233/m.85788 type:complete len:823 (+) Transcript_35233:1616-4084(+)